MTQTEYSPNTTKGTPSLELTLQNGQRARILRVHDCLPTERAYFADNQGDGAPWDKPQVADPAFMRAVEAHKGSKPYTGRGVDLFEGYRL